MATEVYFSTDVLADILRRLPPSSRRRARLVCRCWRYVVDKHTTEMQSRAKPLIWKDGVAYIVDNLSPESRGICKELWRRRTLTDDWKTRLNADWRTRLADDDNNTHLIGTCNGLLCFCVNEQRIGGCLTVVNPSTRETLPVPSLPSAGLFVGCDRRERWDAAYSFAYHPTTGKYKVVHVPCSYDRLCDFETVQVLTLGETAWREVPAPVGGARCDVAAGIVSLDGVTHWVKMGGDTRIVSFDLETEKFVSAATLLLPRLPDKRSSYHLTEVRGRLGFVILPDVWVLEQGRQRWSRRYRLHTVVPRPHFVFGDCVLTRRNNFGFFGHWPKSTPSSGWGLECEGVLWIDHCDQGTLVGKMAGQYHYFDGDCYRTFAYVKTAEPLSVYASN